MVYNNVLEGILQHTTYGALDASHREALVSLFEGYQNSTKVELDYTTLFKNRTALGYSYEYYANQLSNLNPARFQFLTLEQKKAQQQTLYFTFFIISAQCRLNNVEGARQQFAQHSDEIKRCAEYIQILERSINNKDEPQEGLQAALDASEKHLKYLGMTIVARELQEEIMGFISDPETKAREQLASLSGSTTDDIRGVMCEVNERRLLYWVWGGSLLDLVLEALPNEFTRKSQAIDALNTPAQVMGYTSWVLYYARFGLELGLLLKHTFAGATWNFLVNQEEHDASLSVGERFATQWEQRRFRLLNDSIWGLANMACFLWLNSRRALGNYGNALTGVLLIFDVVMESCIFWHEDTLHQAQIARFKKDITIIQANITNLENKRSTLASFDEEALLEETGLHLDSVTQALHQCEVDWVQESRKSWVNIYYALGLLFSFSLMCCFYFPPLAMVPVVGNLLGITGGVLCFVSTVASEFFKAHIDMEQSWKTRDELESLCQQKLQQFKDEKDERVKQLLYLDLQTLKADDAYQKELILYQEMKLLRNVMIDAAAPGIIFMSLVFLPTGVGVCVMASGFALVQLSNWLIESYQPQKTEAASFKEDEYKRFKQHPPERLKDFFRSDAKKNELPPSLPFLENKK